MIEGHCILSYISGFFSCLALIIIGIFMLSGEKGGYEPSTKPERYEKPYEKPKPSPTPPRKK